MLIKDFERSNIQKTTKAKILTDAEWEKIVAKWSNNNERPIIAIKIST
jgi:hypothetical protein